MKIDWVKVGIKMPTIGYKVLLLLENETGRREVGQGYRTKDNGWHKVSLFYYDISLNLEYLKVIYWAEMPNLYEISNHCE